MQERSVIRKDDVLRLTIEDLSSEGEGIGKHEGVVLFVKDALIGDEIEAKVMKMKKTYGYARLIKVLKPSPDRVEAKCPCARSCGGCQLQEMSYEAQLRFKEKKVRNNLVRIGGFLEEELPMEPIIGMEDPFRYRNKAQFPVGLDKNGRIAAGFYAGRTHSIISNRNCLLGVTENERILNMVISFMEVYQIPVYNETTGKGLVRHLLIRKGFQSGELMVCVIINGEKLPKAEVLTEMLQQIPGMTSISININRENSNVILGKETRILWGRAFIEDSIGDVIYQISAQSFYQVNPVQTGRLYGQALEYAGLTGKETVWDLYCGIGTISLFLAQKAKQVYGVEIVPEAIEDAKKNAVRNRISNAEFFVGKAEEIVPEKYEKERIHADVIVVDPPRKGCEETLLQTMLKMQPERIVYVSCDSATLARDLRILCDGGYRLEHVQPVDQFPMTVHVETIVLLHRMITS